jgi:hypothetical protein
MIRDNRIEARNAVSQEHNSERRSEPVSRSYPE